MKTLFIAACLSTLLFYSRCREDNYLANPVPPPDPPPSFQTYVQYMDGGLRVVFIPSTNLTISQVIISEPGKNSRDTVNTPEPSKLYSKGQSYPVEGYTADGLGTEGEFWTFLFTGSTQPAGTPYTSSAVWGVP